MENLKSHFSEEKLLTAAIIAAVNVESQFKLYAYRCIPPEIFCEELVQYARVILKAEKDAKDKYTKQLNVEFKEEK